MKVREKRIITLLSRYGALSKKELAERESISWATAVKSVARLEKEGIIQSIGVNAQPGTTGKNPIVYDLAERHPLAIGIDVTAAQTRLVMTNLKHTIVAQQMRQTPKHPNAEQLVEFLAECSLIFAQQHLSEEERLQGIGIGLPVWLTSGAHTPFFSLAKTLESRLQTAVRIENNIRAYTMYVKWAGPAFSLQNFLLISLRNGVGTGIFYQGDLIRGTHEMAGELSHLPVAGRGKRCRCGQRGCLETVVNAHLLYREYLRKVKEVLRPAPPETEADLRKGLAELFTFAKQGQPEAAAIVQQAAAHLGQGLVVLLKVLDIPDLLLTADFGPDGDAIIPDLYQETGTRLLPGTQCLLHYYPLEQDGFARGAALLILKDYFTTL
ncbi:hypothetical protein CSB45_07460 [candidate division KSB3 bacterium]|uniref:HTH marR-type domain-containing protein n=1 Tax=candidate division KSB3 bacterium TaxID=2044937 RepID=A0A2G6E5J9_9BACT|nr:MAG: hypothetical protein CSB45_07460 [candidate division KSB3 bacterium]PIE29872.1 MAG: hypothetical protein CSA57_06165 [candidate division KSB3 bacterium]